MKKWEENRRFIVGLAIAALSVPAAWVTVITWAGGHEDNARDDLKALSETLRAERRGIYDVAEASESFLKANGKLDGDVKDLMKRVEIPFHTWVEIPPEYANDPAAHFRTKHEEQWDELHRACLIKGVTLCKDIGFNSCNILFSNIHFWRCYLVYDLFVIFSCFWHFFSLLLSVT